jgi:hypothetical protein
MKKGILIVLGMFLMVSAVEAKNGNNLTKSNKVNYSYENSVHFITSGIEFYIFTNGDFDFNSNFNNVYSNYNNAHSSRSELTISRDYNGNIKRVGPIYIAYDFKGNVSRIGAISMGYYRNRLTNVGHLKVRYNRWGNPVFYGNVRANFYEANGVRINLNIGAVCSYNDAYFFRNDFRRNYTQYREDSRFFYYKANRNANIGKRNKILKRRKPVASHSNNSTYDKRKNTSYRKGNAIRKNAAKANRKSNTKRSATIDSKRSKIRRNISKSAKKENYRKAKVKRKTSSTKKVKTQRRS